LETNFLSEIHTKVVHFPIALITTYSLLEIVGIIIKKEFISKSALLVLCLGVATTLLAVFTGNQAATDFPYWTEESKSLLNSHQNFATYLLWLSVIVCGMRIYLVAKKKFSELIKYGFLLLAIVILYFVYQTGIHGGDLVKKYGIGTDVYQNYESQ